MQKELTSSATGLRQHHTCKHPSLYSDSIILAVPPHYTGIQAPAELPQHPFLRLDTSCTSHLEVCPKVRSDSGSAGLTAGMMQSKPTTADDVFMHQPCSQPSLLLNSFQAPAKLPQHCILQLDT
jgi:hypothetical protein